MLHLPSMPLPKNLLESFGNTAGVVLAIKHFGLDEEKNYDSPWSQHSQDNFPSPIM